MATNGLPPLIAYVKADVSGFSAGMGKVKEEAEAAKGVGGTAFAGLASAGKVAFMGLAGAAIIGGAAAVHMAGDWQSTMTTLVTGAGESKQNIDLVSQGMLDMAGQVGMSAQSLASGMYMIESAGFHGAAGLTVLRTASEGAKVGGADMATVANALTSALNAYHMPASAATSVTNDLIATVASGKMHMEDLATSLGTVLPEASALKIPLDQVTGAIATMTMQGTDAATATTGLRFLMSSLANPTGKAKDAFKEFGLTADEVGASLQTRGLTGTMQMLTDTVGQKFPVGSSQYIAAMADMVGGTRGLNATLELTGGNMATWKANVAGIDSAVASGKGAVTGWADVQRDFNERLERGRDALGSFGIEMGTRLIPVVERGMDIGTQWVGWLTKHHDIAIALASAIGGVLLVAIGAYTVAMVSAAVATIAATWPILAVVAAVAAITFVIVAWHGQISKWIEGHKAAAVAIMLLTGPIGLIIGLGSLLITHWGQVTAFLGHGAHEIQAAWNAIPGVVGNARAGLASAVTAVGGFFSELGTTIHNTIVGVVASFAWLYNHNYYFADLVNFIKATWDSADAATTTAWNAITKFLAGAWSTITSDLGRFADAVGSIFGRAKAQAVEVVSGMIDSIGSQLSGLATQAFQWGANVIGGLVKGIESKAGDVGKAASGIANDISSYLGFHSPPAKGPASDADVWMPNMIKMLTGGMQAGAGQVQTSSAALAGGVVSGSGGAASGGSLVELLQEIRDLLAGTQTSHLTVQIGDETIMRMVSRGTASALAGSLSR